MLIVFRFYVWLIVLFPILQLLLAEYFFLHFYFSSQLFFGREIGHVLDLEQLFTSVKHTISSDITACVFA